MSSRLAANQSMPLVHRWAFGSRARDHHSKSATAGAGDEVHLATVKTENLQRHPTFSTKPHTYTNENSPASH